VRTIKGQQATITTKLITVWTANRRQAHGKVMTGWILCRDRLSPPHFPFIYRIHKPSGYWVVEMEHIEGVAPAEWNEAQGKAILKELKQANIFHRDIRLANLIERSTGEWCLLDFGWACDYDNPYPAPRCLGAEGRGPKGRPDDAYAMSIVKRRLEAGKKLGKREGIKYDD
jgi:hypothetical protein